MYWRQCQLCDAQSLPPSIDLSILFTKLSAGESFANVLLDDAVLANVEQSRDKPTTPPDSPPGPLHSESADDEHH